VVFSKMISVVVPFYNEEDNIEPLHAQLSDVLKSLKRDYKIFFVDDGSTDNIFKNKLTFYITSGKIDPVEVYGWYHDVNVVN